MVSAACDRGEKATESASAPTAAPVLRSAGALRPLRAEGEPIAAPGLDAAGSGLRYVVVQKGAGEPPPPGAEIRIHQTGWLREGEKLGRQIADSRASGAPATFLLAPAPSTLDGASRAGAHLALTVPRRPLALPGLIQAVADMRPGERRWILVPADLAYGNLGHGDLVPPQSDLLFDIELVSYAPLGK